MQGPILAFVYAVKEMLKEGRSRNGLLPVNVAFVFEGEEENGSAGFREAVQANLHWFEGTQLIIISNTLWVGEEVSHLWHVSPGCPEYQHAVLCIKRLVTCTTSICRALYMLSHPIISA